MKSPAPDGLAATHWYQFCLAVAVQLTVGVPYILYAKSLGASSTVLGVIAASFPMLNVIQIPASKYLERHSYRQFSLMAWWPHLFFSFAIALIPMFVFFGTTEKIALLLLLLLSLNFLRCLSSMSWLPWMTAIVPAGERGQFLSHNQIFASLGSLLSFGIAMFLMKGGEAPWRYSLVFLIGAMGGLASYHYLKRIPEAAVTSTLFSSSQRVPWGALLSHRPFLKLLSFNLVCMATIGSIDVFRIEFLSDEKHFSAFKLLFLAAFSHVGMILLLPFTGRALDLIGSKPMLRIASAGYIGAITLWCLIALSVLPCYTWLASTLFISTGAAAGIFMVANSRIAMSTIPEMGRNHFFALYAVILGLGTGIAPVAWGIMLDALSGYEWVIGPFIWKRHSIYFLGLLVCNLVAFTLIRCLDEYPITKTPAAPSSPPSVV